MAIKINQGAFFSSNRKYRYALWRVWDHTKPYVMFIGLNPSIANETDNDPTIRRCINYAKGWDYVFGMIYGMVTLKRKENSCYRYLHQVYENGQT